MSPRTPAELLMAARNFRKALAQMGTEPPETGSLIELWLSTADLAESQASIIANAKDVLDDEDHNVYQVNEEAKRLLDVPPADALNSVKEAVWDQVLDEIEEHEINTAQAREGNPYRTERESEK